LPNRRELVQGGKPLADIFCTLAQWLAPHCGGLGGATRLAERAFRLAGLLPSRLAHLLEFELSCLPEALCAVLHFLEARIQTRYQMGAERRGVNLERGKLTAQSIEIALELRPFLVRLGFASGRLIAEWGRLLVFHFSPHSL
jgi:hypothetical protein